jgi:hypothetical protein
MKRRVIHVLNLKILRLLPQNRGQGLVELAILLPVILIVLSGLMEFGLMLNAYLAMQDAARNAARYASDGLYYSRDSDISCTTTRDFYRQTACLVNQELAQERPEITLNLATGDDIIISAFSVGEGGQVTARHPASDGEAGWSEAADPMGIGSRNQASRFTSNDIESRLYSGAPSTGLVMVEIYYHYEHRLKLPWITVFVPDPLLLHAYAVMPLVSAEPTPTPFSP